MLNKKNIFFASSGLGLALLLVSTVVLSFVYLSVSLFLLAPIIFSFLAVSFSALFLFRKIHIYKGEKIGEKTAEEQFKKIQVVSTGNGKAKEKISAEKDFFDLIVADDLKEIKSRYKKKSIDIHAIDKETNYTPLIWAMISNANRTAKFLISRGVDINVKQDIRDTTEVDPENNKGKGYITALVMAMVVQNMEGLKALVACKQKLEINDKEKELINLAIKEGKREILPLVAEIYSQDIINNIDNIDNIDDQQKEGKGFKRLIELMNKEGNQEALPLLNKIFFKNIKRDNGKQLG